MSTVKESKERRKPCSTGLRWARVVEGCDTWSRSLQARTCSRLAAPFGGLGCRESLYLWSCLYWAACMRPLNGGGTVIKPPSFDRICDNSAWHFSSQNTPALGWQRLGQASIAVQFLPLLKASSATSVTPYKYLLPQTLSQHLLQRTKPATKSLTPSS